MKIPTKYCAIYTRKSTEEGLEQDFNTLDAQREACLSFISSQKAEGWKALSDYYDDGGFTGGNMDRPALKKLLEDIRAGKVNTVVVYKIDRLTRSLMDFSKLVEIFDQYGVTFVSVTQSFNTTTSMGRLTLNVLLSFAQFEREVIGERVRDKIAASKKKGMWMGGNNPIGYERINKQLVPKKEEIPFVTILFERYLALGSVRRLGEEFKEKNIVSRTWVSSKNKQHGGTPYSRGTLYAILSNPVYIGKIRHKKQVYDGLHPAIIDQTLWDKVQRKLKENLVSDKIQKRGKSLLQGKLYDHEGSLYSPSHTNKKGKRYRYYISQNLLQYRNHPQGVLSRLPADEIEDLVRKIVTDQFVNQQSVANILNLDVIEHHDVIDYISACRQEINIDSIICTACQKISLSQEQLRITMNSSTLAEVLKLQFNLTLPPLHNDLTYEMAVPYYVTRTRKGAIMIDTQDTGLSKDDPFNRPDHQIHNWVRGTVWRDMYFKGKMLEEIAAQEKVDVRYVARLIDESLAVI